MQPDISGGEGCLALIINAKDDEPGTILSLPLLADLVIIRITYHFFNP
jgi:hypothetical protein